LPDALLKAREKVREEAIKDPKKAAELKHEEIVNPWLITDLDFALKGNPHVST